MPWAQGGRRRAGWERGECCAVQAGKAALQKLQRLASKHTRGQLHTAPCPPPIPPHPPPHPPPAPSPRGGPLACPPGGSWFCCPPAGRGRACTAPPPPRPPPAPPPPRPPLSRLLPARRAWRPGAGKGTGGGELMQVSQSHAHALTRACRMRHYSQTSRATDAAVPARPSGAARRVPATDHRCPPRPAPAPPPASPASPGSSCSRSPPCSAPACGAAGHGRAVRAGGWRQRTRGKGGQAPLERWLRP